MGRIGFIDVSFLFFVVMICLPLERARAAAAAAAGAMLCYAMLRKDRSFFAASCVLSFHAGVFRDGREEGGS